MKDRISVALALPVDKTFSYVIPAEMESRSRPGCRAIVPFGRQIVTGIIVDDATSEVPRSPLREVFDLPDSEPLLTSDLLELTYWISRYYICSWGEALKAALPAGHMQSGVRVAKASKGLTLFSSKLSKCERHVLRILQEKGGQSLSTLVRKYRIPNALKALQQLEEFGLVTIEEILPRGGISVLWQERISLERDVKAADLIQKAVELDKRAPRQAQILSTIAKQPDRDWPVSELLRVAGAPRSALTALLAAGLLQSEKVQSKRYPTLEALTLRDRLDLPEPNDEQTNAIAEIKESLGRHEARTFLLYGVTGSGKTLVYQKVIEEVLAQGGTALVLVPEISLTPQMVSRFRARFGDRIALQHSAMSCGERTDVWRGIRNGDFPIVIGARSAVFAPLQNLRLIVVDEEGDSSFKQNEPNPRYNARDVALVRARQSGTVVILGSATPSIETFYNATAKRFTLLELSKRVDDLEPPTIRFVSPSKARGKIIGAELGQAVVGRIQQGEQVILLQNRRGFFTYIICAGCGAVCRCRHCEITLTYHKRENSLRCHICGYQTAPPQSCPECNGSLRYSGAGTQRVEDELAQLIPKEKIARLDLDTTRRKGSHHRILQSFARENQAILLGTKMVAKGHDYPRVTLVGIVSADTELAFPDFRCDERSFGLMLQAAGRAGRASNGVQLAEVLIQTFAEDHPVLKLVAAGDYRAFYAREIELRRSLNYPPWGWMILFLFLSKTEDDARAWATKFILEAKRRFRVAEWMGPTPAFRSRLKDRYRFQVVMKAERQFRSTQSKIHSQLREMIMEFGGKLPRSVHMVVDVDPIQLL